MTIENKYNILLINIYGQNRDSPVFYENISRIINQYDGDFIIMGGDFNLVQNFSIDCSNYVNINNPNARNKLLNIKTEYDLVDPWRIQHENTKRYTWFGQNNKKGRLDFFFISKEAMNFVEKSNINQGYRSDHSITEISLSFSNYTKGRGTWKFNNLLLRDKDYVTGVKKVIDDLKKTICSITI